VFTQPPDECPVLSVFLKTPKEYPPQAPIRKFRKLQSMSRAHKSQNTARTGTGGNLTQTDAALSCQAVAGKTPATGDAVAGDTADKNRDAPGRTTNGARFELELQSRPAMVSRDVC
jgi:hypothetical protein